MTELASLPYANSQTQNSQTQKLPARVIVSADAYEVAITVDGTCTWNAGTHERGVLAAWYDTRPDEAGLPDAVKHVS